MRCNPGILPRVTPPGAPSGPPPLAPPIAPQVWAAAPAPPDLATTDVPCISCGYNLRGLSELGRCPECGALIARSLLGNLLKFSNPDYVESLRRGTVMVKWTILALVIVGVFSILVGISGGRALVAVARPTTAVRVAFWATGTLALLSTAANVAFYAGWWLLSAPDPAFVGQETGATSRRVLRISAAAAALTSALAAIFQISVGTPAITGAGPTWVVIGMMAASLAALAAWAVLFFASMKYVRWLAPRLPDPWVDQRAKLLMWLGPLLYIFGCGIGGIVALVLYWNLIERTRSHLAAIRARQTMEPAL